MTRYATAFKGLRIVTLKKKDKKIQDALQSIRNGKLCSSLSTYAPTAIKSADIVLLAYNSEGVVRGVAGVVESDDDLYVSIICNDMGKKNRVEGYAPGRGLLDLLKKIAIRKKKDLTLVSVSNAINYYKRFGFKQHPNSNNKRNLIWPWRPARARRFEYQSVNSKYNSNNNKPTIYRRTRSKVSPTSRIQITRHWLGRKDSPTSPTSSRASPASSSRSSASVKRTGTRRASPVGSRVRVYNPTTYSGRKQGIKRLIANEKELKKIYKRKIIHIPNNLRNKYLTRLKNNKSASVARKKKLKRLKENHKGDFKLLKKMSKSGQVSTRKMLNERYTSRKQALGKQSIKGFLRKFGLQSEFRTKKMYKGVLKKKKLEP